MKFVLALLASAAVVYASSTEDKDAKDAQKVAKGQQNLIDSIKKGTPGKTSKNETYK
jgi:hypothetical protein